MSNDIWKIMIDTRFSIYHLTFLIAIFLIPHSCLSMLEVPYPGKNHRKPMLISGGYDLLVTH